MSASLLPTHWLGITPLSETPTPPETPPTEVTFPVSAIPPTTESQASLEGGDIRAVLYGLLRQVETFYEGLDGDDQPVTFYIASVDNVVSSSALSRTFTVRFRLKTAPSTVDEEP